MHTHNHTTAERSPSRRRSVALAVPESWGTHKVSLTATWSMATVLSPIRLFPVFVFCSSFSSRPDSQPDCRSGTHGQMPVVFNIKHNWILNPRLCNFEANGKPCRLQNFWTNLSLCICMRMISIHVESSFFEKLALRLLPCLFKSNATNGRL